jgi:hypothetical protein
MHVINSSCFRVWLTSLKTGWNSCSSWDKTTNPRRMTIRNRDPKHKLRTKWEQLSGNRKVQELKNKVHNKRKRKLDSTRGADTAAALKITKTSHREAALQQDNLQSTGENELLSAHDVIRLDAQDRLNNAAMS